jgi:hypothetical protein
MARKIDMKEDKEIESGVESGVEVSWCRGVAVPFPVFSFGFLSF